MKNHRLTSYFISFFLSGLLPSFALSETTQSQTVTIDPPLSENNPADSGELNYTNVNLEGNIWATENALVNLIFKDNRTWKMDTSGIQVNHTNIIIHTPISPITSGTTPTLQFRQDSGKSFQSLELINTDAKVKLWQRGSWNGSTKLADTFTLRGTTLETYWGNGNNGGSPDGLHGNTTNGINLVFAKGSKIDTTLSDENNQTLKITDKRVDQGHSGTYTDGVYDGNYIAQSYGKFTKIVTNGSFDITFIGEQSYSDANWATNGGWFGKDSKLALINASGSNAFDATKIGDFFNNNSSARAGIIIEGTTISNGEYIIKRGSNQDKLNFHITFASESGLLGSNSDGQYLGDIIQDVATTNANGALSDRVLKVAESKLLSGLDFKNSNAYVTFIGGSQSLSSSKILKGGSASSIYTFRASHLDLGTLASPSIQGVRGTIAFDLSHGNENMILGGVNVLSQYTLGNMFDANAPGKYQTIYHLNGEKLTLNRLVFADPQQFASLPTLSLLAQNGNYFGDSDVFEILSNAEKSEEYSKIGKMHALDPRQNSRLITPYNVNFVLNGSKQEIIFIGDQSHRFGNTTSSDNHRLGNSADSMLTFIDGGVILRERIMNLDLNYTQQGKGTINLIGNTQITLATFNGSQTLTLADGNEKGAGLTLNAIFTGERPLGDGGVIQSDGSQPSTTPTKGHKASNANIGITDEQTIYHLLFDYTSSNLSFGEHQAYTGAINGLTQDSKIKFKNAGYIWKNQIANTKAEIMLDNTQLREDLRADKAVLDYRNNKLSVAGSILTSDTTNKVLSQKILTFDFTGTTNLESQFRDIYKIQAGRKVATDYTKEADSILTFQNSPKITLNTTKGSQRTLLEGLAKATGFKAFGKADTDGSDFQQNHATKSYILKGADLIFEGTSIEGNIIENNYDLKLTFDTNPTNKTALEERIQASSIQGSITMGTGRKLELILKNKDAIKGEKLDIHANHFNITATSTNGHIGTIVLHQDSNILDAKSSVNIQAGSASFLGHFDSTKDTATSSNIGSFTASFGDTQEGSNRIYGLIKHKGVLNLTLKGNALFSHDEAQQLGYAKSEEQFANLVIDLTTPQSSNFNLTLHHTSGTVGLIGKHVGNDGSTKNGFTNYDLMSSTGSLAIKGAFDLGSKDVTFDANKRLFIAGNTYLKIQNQRSLILKDVGAAQEGKVNLFIDPRIGATSQNVNLTLVNFADNIQVTFMNDGHVQSARNYQGTWNIRGTNIAIDKVFSAENSNNQINMVFAKGNGREVVFDPTTHQKSPSSTLDSLSGEDKINLSSLSGRFDVIKGYSPPTFDPDGHGSSLILKTASLTFIGKEALGIAVGNERIDGSFNNSNANMQIKLYNSILYHGSILLDSSLATIDHGAYQYKITDTSYLLGTDTFNLSVSRIPTPPNDYYGKRLVAYNHSTINAIFVNDGGVSTGNRYIDASQASYAKKYATSDAGGALSQTILKTLYSKAYGNIKLDNTVTANIKFIGENSHSFDGKTAVYTGNDTESKKDGGIYYNPNGDAIQTNWKKIQINNQGIISVSDTPFTQTQDLSLATLSGGNANSKFYFDHTSVKLDLIKNAGGNTYIYNSNIIGKISVDGKANKNGSTTIFFNQVFNSSNPLSQTAQKFVDFYKTQGVDLDLNTPHLLRDSHLTDGKLTTTAKSTNIILIGKKAFEKTQDEDEMINLSFLPQLGSGSGYNYTIVSGGVFDIIKLENILGSTNTERPNNPTNIIETLFGDSKVHLIDTQIIGRIAFGQVGFINVEKNQRSIWTGSSTQHLIYNFNNGKSNLSADYLKEYAIQNRSNKSRYIFTGIFANSNLPDTNRILTLGKNGLKKAINAQLTRSKTTISDFVIGYLGLRGVSIRGDINEDLSFFHTGDTMELKGNSVDIVFNSTRNIAYEEYFDENGEHQANFKVGYANLVSTGLDDHSKISGYAILKPSTTGGDVTIRGNAHKDIVFIGKDAVEGGFSHLKIMEGSQESKYTFHSIGTVDSQFLQGIKLQKTATETTANLGIFSFYNSHIVGDINIDKNPNDMSKEARLFFDLVSYEGSISGTMIKHLKFGENSKVTLLGANAGDVFDFSGLAHKEIYLNLEMKDQNNLYTSPTIIGLDSGNVSVIGHFDLAMNTSQLRDSSQALLQLAFNDTAKWSVSANSQVGNLSLSNSRNTYNLDLASSPRVLNKSKEASFRTLKVGNLHGNNGQILLGSILDFKNQANSMVDQIQSEKISGSFVVNVMDVKPSSATFDTQTNPIILITSTKGDAKIKGRKEESGLMIRSINLEHQIQNNGRWESVNETNFNEAKQQRWVLSSSSIEENAPLITESTALISSPYRMLLVESNNLNKRMGDLRDNPYPHGSWIRIFNGMDSGEGLKNLYTNIQLGFDKGWQAHQGRDYFGLALSTSVTSLDGDRYKGDANTYSFALYNSYIADFGLYIDTILKYLYTHQNITTNNTNKTSFGNHALSLGFELGYQAYIAQSGFYLEPQAEVIYGYIHGIDRIDLGVHGGKEIFGKFDNTHSLYLRAGGVMGYTFKTQGTFSADLRIGASFVNEYIAQTKPISLSDGTDFKTKNIGNDLKALVSIGTNLIVNDQWRVYLDIEKTFGGKRNTEYQANIGARFNFGEKHMPKNKITTQTQGE